MCPRTSHRSAMAAGLLLATVAVWPSSSRAQEASAPTEEQRAARAAFEEGTAAIASGDLDAGVAALRRSLELFPYQPTAYNLAVALSDRGDAAEAAELVRAVLDERFGSLDRSRRRDARRLLRSLRQRIGTVTVRTTGAEDPWIAVDGQQEPIPPDTDRVYYVAPGRHIFEIGAEGVRAHRVALALVEGDRETIRVDLRAPPHGTLRVRSAEPDREVEIVGVTVGPSPLERPLPVGVYEVGLAEMPGSRRSVSVEADLLREVVVEPPPKRWPRVVGGVAAALVAVAAALAVGFVVARDDGGPEEDPVFGTIEALRLP